MVSKRAGGLDGPKDQVPGGTAQAAMIDEGFVQGSAGVGLGVCGASSLDAKTAALVRLGVLVAIGSPAVCLEWSATGALVTGESADEIADVLVAIALVAGLGRVVAAAPDLALALGYDLASALDELNDDRRQLPISCVGHAVKADNRA